MIGRKSMALNTTVFICNNAIPDIREDPEKFVNDIVDGMNGAGRLPLVCGECTVVNCSHSDETVLIAAGGNHATVLGRTSKPGVNHHTDEGVIKLLKEMAASYGFRLVKKPVRVEGAPAGTRPLSSAKSAMDELVKLRADHGHCLSPGLEERSRYLVKVLVDLKHWPAKNKTGRYSAYRMWEGYGPYWNVYEGPLECRHCKADLRNHESGPPFKREIGQVENDRCTHYVCPDCNKAI
jgi:hypothetical protein